MATKKPLYHYILAFDIVPKGNGNESACQESRTKISAWVAVERRGVRLSESCYLFRSINTLGVAYQAICKLLPDEIEAESFISLTQIYSSEQPGSMPMMANETLQDQVLVKDLEVEVSKIRTLASAHKELLRNPHSKP